MEDNILFKSLIHYKLFLTVPKHDKIILTGTGY